MRVCDKCTNPNKPSVCTLNILQEDQWFDLCDKHTDELMHFLQTKEKGKVFRKRKKAA